MTGEKLSISRRTHAVGLGVSLLLVGLQLAAMLYPREDWPFSSAPMFARYQGGKYTPIYYIKWTIRRGEQREPLSARDHLGMGELPFRRGYFAAYYGSTDPRHPGGHFPGDTEAAFVARQSDYCRRLGTAWVRRGHGPAPVFELSVAKGGRGSIVQEVPIGSCQAGRFVRSP